MNIQTQKQYKKIIFPASLAEVKKVFTYTKTEADKDNEKRQHCHGDLIYYKLTCCAPRTTMVSRNHSITKLEIRLPPRLL